ncbi:unnamed protein product [Cylicostephanus goldi]|uniref:Uncharacterized protein n=1 Tax=Cylicostephanus goldi TaxID=71465 RepID=A0A3P6QK51_CYLGO|nr:unnamed protein product [Cylicostephanus goldi]
MKLSFKAASFCIYPVLSSNVWFYDLIVRISSYDVERIKEVGPDRAAAEWVVRCGGAVKFDKIDNLFSDYNALIKRCAELDPRVPADNVKITHIHAIDASVSGYGCRHFSAFWKFQNNIREFVNLEGLDGLQEVKFIRCGTLHDFGLEYMADAVGGHLSRLEIDSCRRITEFGLIHLERCRALKSLRLAHLKHVHGHDKVLQRLTRALPNTEISFVAH